jgi:cyclase
VREIKPGTFVLMAEDVMDVDGDPQFSRAGNAGFVATNEGVLVINTMNTPFRARELLYEIRRRTDQSVRYVINTDGHADLMLGNEVFVDQRSTIIATRAAGDAMKAYRTDLARRLAQDENWRLQGRMRGIHPTPPVQTFDSEMTIQLGGEEIRLTQLSGGHSAGDAVVYLPAQRVLFLGHLFENGFFPRFASSNVRRWIEILRQLEAWDVEVYVPAHGPPGDRKQLAEFRRFLEWLWNEVMARVEEGKSLADVRRELNLTETYRWSARDLAPRAVEEVYQQVTREQALSSPTDASQDEQPPAPASEPSNQVP